MNDDEAQLEAEKKELTRLLGTAKDEERKDVIRKAISALESTHSDNSVTKNDRFSPIGSGNYAHLMSNQKMPFDKMKAVPSSGGARPLSARNRSTSNLEVIHENTSHLAEARRIAQTIPISPIPENCTYLRLSSQDTLSCVKITINDVADIIATSFDARYPISNIIPGNSTNRQRAYWVSTGLVPHTICVQLVDFWYIRQVEIAHQGVLKMSISFGDSLKRFGSSQLMMAEGRSLIYSDRKEDSAMTPSRAADSTNMIMLVITDIEGLFFTLQALKIYAEKDTGGKRPKG